MRTITIKSKGLGRFDDGSPFLVESGTLELKIVLPKVSGEFFFVGELNGKGGPVILIPKDGTIALGVLESGELRSEVKHYQRGTLIETYKVEPLLLKAVDTSLSAMPEIAFLTGECAELREKLELAEESLVAAAEREEEAKNRDHARDLAFVAYAWADYQNNLQLNAKTLPLEKFAVALGYDLEEFSEEEIQKIKTIKEEL